MFYIPLCECARYIYKFMARIQYCYLPMSVLFLWTQSPPPPKKKPNKKPKMNALRQGICIVCMGHFLKCMLSSRPHQQFLICLSYR